MTPSQQYRPRVVLVDDHASVRRALCGLLGPSCEVVASVDNGHHAIEAAVTLKPDIMVVDLMMPEMDGLEVCRRMKEVAPETDVIIMTAFDDAHIAKVVVEAGASGFLPKHAAAGTLKSTIEGLIAKRAKGRQPGGEPS